MTAMKKGDVWEGFRLVEQIGEGGFASVWSAIDEEGNDVCIKWCLPIPETISDEKREHMLSTFRIEASATSKIRHPNVAKLLGTGTREGRPYLVYELVDGATLWQMLNAHGKAALPTAQVLPIAIAVASGVGRAHELDLIHRDLKPGNVAVHSNDGIAVVLDFGSARINATSMRAAARWTGIGTPEYMSPEQIAQSPLTLSSDVFSLGLMMFECLSPGRTSPYAGSDGPSADRNNQLAGTRTRWLPTDSDIPIKLIHAIDRCLAYDPSHRYPSAGELAKALEAIASEFGPLDLQGVAALAEKAALGRSAKAAEKSELQKQLDNVGVDPFDEPGLPTGPDSEAIDDDGPVSELDDGIAPKTVDRGRRAKVEPPPEPPAEPPKQPPVAGTKTVLNPEQEPPTLSMTEGEIANHAAAHLGGLDDQLAGRGDLDGIAQRSEAAIKDAAQLELADTELKSVASTDDAFFDAPPVTDTSLVGILNAARQVRWAAALALLLLTLLLGWLLTPSVPSASPVADTAADKARSEAAPPSVSGQPPAIDLLPAPAEPSLAATPETTPDAGLLRSAAALDEPTPKTGQPAKVPTRKRTARRKAADATVSLSIGVLPEGIVRVDGGRATASPAKVMVAPGRHRITVRSGAVRDTRVVDVPDQMTHRVTIDLRDK